MAFLLANTSYEREAEGRGSQGLGPSWYPEQGMSTCWGGESLEPPRLATGPLSDAEGSFPAIEGGWLSLHIDGHGGPNLMALSDS